MKALDNRSVVPSVYLRSRGGPALGLVTMAANSRPAIPLLLDRARRGDEAALTEIIQQYEGRLRAAAKALIGPRLRATADVVDLLQSVHLALLPGLRSGKYLITNLAQLVALALAVLRHLVADKWRHLRSELEQRGEGPPSGSHVERAEADPATAVQLADSLSRLLDGLDATERRVVELRVQGFNMAEIAEELHCDVHALRARLSRLRRHLRDDGPGDLP